jgi:hypothetical protein
MRIQHDDFRTIEEAFDLEAEMAQLDQLISEIELIDHDDLWWLDYEPTCPVSLSAPAQGDDLPF